MPGLGGFIVKIGGAVVAPDVTVDSLRTAWFTSVGTNSGRGCDMSVQRQKTRFTSGDTECAAWHYPGRNGGCVVMAGGFAVTKEPGTDLFARRFHQAGFAVLAFDYRHLDESGGQPARSRGSASNWPAGTA